MKKNLLMSATLIFSILVFFGCFEKWRNFKHCNVDACKFNPNAMYKVMGLGTADEALKKCGLEGLPNETDDSYSMVFTEFQQGHVQAHLQRLKEAGDDMYKLEQLKAEYEKTELGDIISKKFFSYQGINWPGSSRPLVLSRGLGDRTSPNLKSYIICYKPDQDAIKRLKQADQDEIKRREQAEKDALAARFQVNEMSKPDYWKTTLLIAYEDTDYKKALQKANELEKETGIKFTMRDRIYDETKGLIKPPNGAADTPERIDNTECGGADVCLSIERTYPYYGYAYKGVKHPEGYIIVLGVYKQEANAKAAFETNKSKFHDKGLKLETINKKDVDSGD